MSVSSNKNEIHDLCLIIQYRFQLTESLPPKSHSMLVGKSGGSKRQIVELTKCQTHVTGVGAVTSTASTNTATSTSGSPPTVTAADRMTAAPVQRAPNAPRVHRDPRRPSGPPGAGTDRIASAGLRAGGGQVGLQSTEEASIVDDVIGPRGRGR